MFKAKKSVSKILENWQKMAYQIDQRSIQCWVRSKLQSALILQCFLEFSPPFRVTFESIE